MWPVPFLVEGVIIGILVSELGRRKLLWKFVAGLVVLACVAPLVGCALAPEAQPSKASRWMGACEVCELHTENRISDGYAENRMAPS